MKNTLRRALDAGARGLIIPMVKTAALNTYLDACARHKVTAGVHIVRPTSENVREGIEGGLPTPAARFCGWRDEIFAIQ